MVKRGSIIAAVAVAMSLIHVVVSAVFDTGFLVGMIEEARSRPVGVALNVGVFNDDQHNNKCFLRINLFNYAGWQWNLTARNHSDGLAGCDNVIANPNEDGSFCFFQGSIIQGNHYGAPDVFKSAISYGSSWVVQGYRRGGLAAISSDGLSNIGHCHLKLKWLTGCRLLRNRQFNSKPRPLFNLHQIKLLFHALPLPISRVPLPLPYDHLCDGRADDCEPNKRFDDQVPERRPIRGAWRLAGIMLSGWLIGGCGIVCLFWRFGQWSGWRSLAWRLAMCLFFVISGCVFIASEINALFRSLSLL